MLDFPSFRPTVGDHTRFNEPFYHNLARVLVDELPCCPHWTKNTREVFTPAAKKIDPDAVREQFDPKGIFRSVVGEAIGVY
ncbi:FAD/FMN-containing dehydrogenase [Colletotrichum higginsianum]|uniref:FAD/FMN-containing dehydrogenase n=1 Tax=Colletotrichum higginsianum (strain IMI 349063) TaxID=759273 RepID=H1V2M5_COLHI|nr:FAD/FMN-containing dehydrogenase [Colletotrichum higginsianum IMI 349063]OBR08433.1 FAD/FMN-containing dehydrogenase [Colletotrichum higginsianum IMI 349063]GJC97490.1 FAD/FMN-containing dehydrogenase [Colletotrichum higginsianum]CCF34477.1 FAD/FMN-containing dehydrogenase [Colletotrichum higginsianum]